MSKVLAVAAGGLMLSITWLASEALAQSKAAVGGMVTLKLSDPAGGEAWRVQRELLRTFSSLQECENQKNSFSNFHIGRIERHGLVTASGAAPLVEIESIECFTMREHLLD